MVVIARDVQTVAVCSSEKNNIVDVFVGAFHEVTRLETTIFGAQAVGIRSVPLLHQCLSVQGICTHIYNESLTNEV